MKRVLHWKDENTWPANWLGSEIEPNSKEAYKLALRLKAEYDYFVAYHACRPIDVSSYYKDGLRIARHYDLVEIAQGIFANGNFDEISRDDVFASAQEMPSTSDNRLYVALDDRHIINWCGDYLLYGSEYVIGIAAGLSRNHISDYRQYLKNFGKPTIFKLQLPLTLMSVDCLAELASGMSRAVFNNDIAHEEDFTVTLHQPVPPEFITSHFHPTYIEDPLA